MIEKIVHIYENILPKLPSMLSHEEAIQYFTRLLMNGNIIMYVKDGELLGFMEYWRITNEQFGRICCNQALDHSEDLISGNVCLITRMWITPTLRNGETFLNMGREFLNKNTTATHYAAIQMHKNHKPLQVYNREQILKHYQIGE